MYLSRKVGANEGARKISGGRGPLALRRTATGLKRFHTQRRSIVTISPKLENEGSNDYSNL